MAEDFEELKQRYNRLKSDRANWESHWDEVAAYCAPRRIGFTGQRTPGEKRHRQIYNPIGVQCVTTLAAALHGYVMNPSTIWMGLRTVDEETNDSDSARKWLDDTAKLIMIALQSPQTAFHVHANQVFEDMASTGTACMYVGQKKTGPLFVRTYSVAEVMIAEDQYGQVDTVMRETKYSARQMVQTWGNKVSERVKKMVADKKQDDLVTVIHVVKPRKEYDTTKTGDTENMPWVSCYFETEGEHILEENGVEEMPYVVPRWAVSCGENYGRSPAMAALPQIKLANVAAKALIEGAEKAVSPPLQVPHEGVVSPVRTSPNGLTFVRGANEIKQLPSSQSLPFAADWLQQLNNEIRTSMFVDQVQFVGDFKMTATEVVQRSTERMRLLGPVLGRLENEFLNPLISRVFGILSRLKVIPEPPEGMEGQEIRVEYVSPLARAQKSGLAQSFQMAMATLMPFMENPQLAEQIIAPIDLTKVTRTVFDWYGVDTDLLKGDDQIEDDKAAINQRQQMAMIPTLAKAARDGGGAAKDMSQAGKNAAEVAAMTGAAAPPGAAAGGGGAAPAATTPPGAAPPPPAQGGGMDLASLLGSIVRGGANSIPGAVGGPQSMRDAMTRQ
jgi:hypothetical protein